MVGFSIWLGLGMDSLSITQWLVTEGRKCGSPAALLDRYCHRLRNAGVPVERATLGAPLLHPIAQSSYVFWSLDKGAQQRWFQWTPESLDTMRASPIYPIYTQGRSAHVDLADPGARSMFPITQDLWSEGFTAYDALALPFPDGTHKALTLATRAHGGFTQANRQAITQTLPALALVFEGYIAANTARTLMETYVGKRAGLRVLNGEIARGDGSMIDAVIWFSDLRGFTELSRRHSEEELLALLNDYFGLLTGNIESHDGEILKFIGDAVLAIFPFDNDTKPAVARAESAATAALKEHHEKFAGSFSFGIGLHVGRVFYGNIGGGTRLDFTVIGDAVNIASRIEGLTGKLGEPLLVSGAFASLSGNEWRAIGKHALKGVDEALPILAPNSL
jgi:adenylate cyclase